MRAVTSRTGVLSRWQQLLFPGGGRLCQTSGLPRLWSACSSRAGYAHSELRASHVHAGHSGRAEGGGHVAVAPRAAAEVQHTQAAYAERHGRAAAVELVQHLGRHVRQRTAYEGMRPAARRARARLQVRAGTEHAAVIVLSAFSDFQRLGSCCALTPDKPRSSAHVTSACSKLHKKRYQLQTSCHTALLSSVLHCSTGQTCRHAHLHVSVRGIVRAGGAAGGRGERFCAAGLLLAAAGHRSVHAIDSRER